MNGSDNEKFINIMNAIKSEMELNRSCMLRYDRIMSILMRELDIDINEVTEVIKNE